MDKNSEKLAEARFEGIITGSVWLRWLGSPGEDAIDAIIQTDLRYMDDQTQNDFFTEHRWKIYVTDILDAKGILYKTHDSYKFAIFFKSFSFFFQIEHPATFFKLYSIRMMQDLKNPSET